MTKVKPGTMTESDWGATSMWWRRKGLSEGTCEPRTEWRKDPATWRCGQESDGGSGRKGHWLCRGDSRRQTESSQKRRAMDRRDSWGGGCSLISSSLRWLLRGVGWFQPCLVTEAREGSRSHVHVPPAPASTKKELLQEGWAPSLPAPRSFQFLYAPGVRLPAPGSQGKLSECAGVAASEPTSHLSVAPKQGGKGKNNIPLWSQPYFLHMASFILFNLTINSLY